MSWVAVAVAGAEVVGGAVSASASRRAANTQTNAAQSANATQLQMFNQLSAQQQPFMNLGYGAGDRLGYLLGITPRTASGNAPGTPDNVAGNGTFKPSDLIRLRQQGMSTNDILRLGMLSGTTKASDYQTLLRSGFTAQDLSALQTGKFLPEQAGATSQPGAPNSGSDYMPTPGGGVQRIAGTNDVSTNQGMTPSGMPTASNDPAFGSLTRMFSPQDFMSGIDPGYGWRLQQGAQAVQNSAAAGSGSLSGNALKDLMSYGQGEASQEYQNAFNRYQTQTGNIYQRLLGLTTLGQSAAANTGQMGTTTAGNIGANIVGAGNAQAAGQIGQANAISGAVGNLGSLALLYGSR